MQARWWMFLAALPLAACGDRATLPLTAGMGPNPTLPPPHTSLLPTLNVATAKPWVQGETPIAGNGLKVAAFAQGLAHPRWLYVLPNGDVLVAETNAPERPKEGKGIRGWFMKQAQKKAGAGAPNANRITLLRDKDGDGVAETRSVLLANLNAPYGMALIGDQLYVANTDAVVRVPYQEGTTQISTPPAKVADLPGGPRNHHWTKNILADPDGTHLYATVGSNSNVAENGMEEEKERAAILEIDFASGKHRIFASGLRNPNGLDWEPESGALWTVVNERDELGSDLVPDYMTAVKDGGFYGWPYSYYGGIVDKRPKPQRPDLVATAIIPDYALGPHTASLGLIFSRGTAALPPPFAQGVFIGQHGSWNRDPHSGYQVIFVPFAAGRPQGMPVDVLTGFLNDKREARGRPVGVAIDKAGALLVADDVGNTVWRVTAR